MDPIIFAHLSYSNGNTVIQLAGERIQQLSEKLNQEHTTASRSALLMQITTLTEIIQHMNRAMEHANRLYTKSTR